MTGTCDAFPTRCRRVGLHQRLLCTGTPWSSALTCSVIDETRYILGRVIRSFGNKDTDRLWHREFVPSIDPRIHSVALRKLRQVGSAESLDDLRVPPGTRLEPLKGDRAGQHSIRINDQCRICFVWTDAGPEEVEIVDHH